MDHLFGTGPTLHQPYRTMNMINPRDAMMGDLVRQKMQDMIRSSVYNKLTMDEIYKGIEYVMDIKMIMFQDLEMCKTPFGLQVHHCLTGEDPQSLHRFVFIYVINKTTPANVVQQSGTPSIVEMEKIEKLVELELPIEKGVAVQKDLYMLMKQAMDHICGIGLSDAWKPYAGEPKLPTGSDLMFRQSIGNYMSRINTSSLMVGQALSQGKMSQQLNYIYSRSPILFTLQNRESYRGTVSNHQWAMIIMNAYSKMCFGLNKMMHVHRENSTSRAWLNEVIKIFLINTSTTCTPEFLPSFNNAPFKSIRGVITVTDNIKRSLQQQNMLNTAYDVEMVQKQGFMKLGVDDMHPLDNRAPHSSAIRLENGYGMYQHNPNGSMSIHEIKTVTNIDYVQYQGSGDVFVVSTISDGDFGGGNCNTVAKSGMKQISRFDQMVPVCVQMIEGANDDGSDATGQGIDNKLYPLPSVTRFKDKNGLTRQLSLSSCRDWLKAIFNKKNLGQRIPKKCLPPEDRKKKTNNKWTYFSASIRQQMVFYAVLNQRRSATDNRDDLVLLTYTVSNGHMTREIFLSNVLKAYEVGKKPVRAPGVAVQPISRQMATIVTAIAADEQNYSPGISNEIINYLMDVGLEKDFRAQILAAAFKALKMTTPPTSVDYPPARVIPTLTGTQPGTANAEMSTEDVMLTKLLDAYVFCVDMKNGDFELYHLKDEFNPGIGVLFVKPILCESESIVVSQPLGYTHIAANPQPLKQLNLSDDSKDIVFNWKQHSAHCPNSLSNTSIKVPMAYMNHNLTDDSSLAVNPKGIDARIALEAITNGASSDEVLLNMNQGESYSRYWPWICQSRWPSTFFENGGSPVGHLATQYPDVKSFDRYFHDSNSLDCMFPHTYSVNKIHRHSMWCNINVYFYHDNFLSHPDCPLYKYMNYNKTSASVIAEAKTNLTRRDSLHAFGGSFSEVNEQKGWTRHVQTTDISRATGIAFPKRCWTAPEILKQENQHKIPTPYPNNSVVTSESLSNNWFIPGTTIQEKYDSSLNHDYFNV